MFGGTLSAFEAMCFNNVVFPCLQNQRSTIEITAIQFRIGKGLVV